MSDALIDAAWTVYATPDDGCVVRPSIPILYFGDADRYARSPLKVATVALNPSHHEFPAADRFARFPLARAIDPRTVDEAARVDYRRALDGYFRQHPYRRWFGWFDAVLRGMDASYWEGEPHPALHTDLCSPLATNPTWSGLGPRREPLERAGIDLWHRLIDELAPDVLVVSVATRYRDRITLARPDAWAPLITIPRADPARRPYRALVQRSTLPSGKATLLVFGPAAQQPFATLTAEQRGQVGRAALEVLRAR